MILTGKQGGHRILHLGHVTQHLLYANSISDGFNPIVHDVEMSLIMDIETLTCLAGLFVGLQGAERNFFRPTS